MLIMKTYLMLKEIQLDAMHEWVKKVPRTSEHTTPLRKLD